MYNYKGSRGRLNRVHITVMHIMPVILYKRYTTLFKDVKQMLNLT